MDTDINHATEERLAAIEARLDALENPAEVDQSPPDSEDGGEEVVPSEASVGSRSRRGRSSSLSESASYAVSESPEGGVE